jgi:hypothetical protein
MHGFACRNTLHLMPRRWLLALPACGVCAVLSALATTAPARADSVTDWDQIASTVDQVDSERRVAQGTVVRGDATVRLLRLGSNRSRTCLGLRSPPDSPASRRRTSWLT